MEDCLKMSKTYLNNKEIIFFLEMNVNEKFDKVYIPYLLLFLFDYIIV